MTSSTTTADANQVKTAGRKYLQVALAAAALMAAGAAPALAATHHHHRAARTSRPLQMYAGESFGQGIDMMGDTQVDAKRAAALHDCSVAASKYNFSTWQTAQFATFGTCMMNYGETP